jgi:hypothetical protein
MVMAVSIPLHDRQTGGGGEAARLGHEQEARLLGGDDEGVWEVAGAVDERSGRLGRDEQAARHGLRTAHVPRPLRNPCVGLRPL